MKLGEIIYENECPLSKKDKDRKINNITVRQNEISDNTLLFILSEKYLYDCIGTSRHPSVVVIDKNINIEGKIFGRSTLVLMCDDARSLLAHSFSRFYKVDYSRFLLIGVTGTNGKSSTASFISSVLSDSGYRVGFIGTGKIVCNGTLLSGKEYSMTTPDPWILYPALKEMEERGCNAVVMEVSSHALALRKVSPIKFNYAVFTNLSDEHLDFHSDTEEYFSCKSRLFTQADNAIINIDDSYGRRLYDSVSIKKKSVGILWSADARATHIENNGFSGSEYMYRECGLIFKMKLNTPGVHNIYNSLLAAATCTDIGVKPCMVKRSLSAISALPGRFEIIKSDITVIIDYAHTAFAFETLLKEISRAKLPSERLITVFGCGGERDREKRPRMAEISEKYAAESIVTSDNDRGEPSEQIINDIVVGFKRDTYRVIPDRATAIETAIISARPSDIVAVIGKGEEKYRIDASGYHDFDEREIILSAIAKRTMP